MSNRHNRHKPSLCVTCADHSERHKRHTPLGGVTTVTVVGMVPMPPFLSAGGVAGGGYAFALCGLLRPLSANLVYRMRTEWRCQKPLNFSIRLTLEECCLDGNFVETLKSCNSAFNLAAFAGFSCKIISLNCIAVSFHAVQEKGRRAYIRCEAKCQSQYFFDDHANALLFQESVA